MLLEEPGVKYDFIDVDRAKTRGSPNIEINPSGRVPVLEGSEPASDTDTGAVGSLKLLDTQRPIREADVTDHQPPSEVSDGRW